MTRSFLIGLAATLSATGAPAADPAPPDQNSERICRGGGARTLGSHIRTRRRCLTAEQWRQEDEARSRTPPLQITEGQNDGHGPAQPR